MGSVLDFRLILVDLRSQFGDFQVRHDLAGFYAATVIDEQFLNIAGFLSVDVDLLERHQFRGQSPSAPQLFLNSVHHSRRDVLLSISLTNTPAHGARRQTERKQCRYEARNHVRQRSLAKPHASFASRTMKVHKPLTTNLLHRICTCTGAPSVAPIAGTITRYRRCAFTSVSTSCRIGPMALTIAAPAGFVMNDCSGCSAPVPSGFSARAST